MNNHQNDYDKKTPYANPYVVGVLLGLTLLASFLLLGAGLGASGGISRLGAYLSQTLAPAHTAASAYFGQWGNTPLQYYLVWMMVGVLFGGLLSALLANRAGIVVEKGRLISITNRLLLALTGGVLVGFASRLARGCTSGQALTGGALLLSGSLVFLVCLFAGGYAAAYFVRRQWHD